MRTYEVGLRQWHQERRPFPSTSDLDSAHPQVNAALGELAEDFREHTCRGDVDVVHSRHSGPLMVCVVRSRLSRGLAVAFEVFFPHADVWELGSAATQFDQGCRSGSDHPGISEVRLHQVDGFFGVGD